jgi:vacuolar-type H+-ATPase subunit H
MSEVLSAVSKAEAEATKMLENARTKAEQIRREAERNARTMSQAIRQELLQEIETLRQETEKKSRAKAKQIAAQADGQVAALQELGTKNMAKAVDFILKAVYEMGGASK